MSARVTRKRARTEEEESQVVKPEEASANTGTSSTNERTTGISDFGEPSQLKKDEEFWFDDGTVILHAGDVEFRVYRGLLESHSTVFRGAVRPAGFNASGFVRRAVQSPMPYRQTFGHSL